jgi:hypothetical protein
MRFPYVHENSDWCLLLFVTLHARCQHCCRQSEVTWSAVCVGEAICSHLRFWRKSVSIEHVVLYTLSFSFVFMSTCYCSLYMSAIICTELSCSCAKFYADMLEYNNGINFNIFSSFIIYIVYNCVTYSRSIYFVRPPFKVYDVPYTYFLLLSVITQQLPRSHSYYQCYHFATCFGS